MAARCPSCDIPLTNDEAFSGYCPYCGKAAEEGDAGAQAIVCPCCDRESDSIKSFNMGILLFIFVAWLIWPRQEVACPGCIRGKLIGFLLINIITANILWPFLIVPWSVILLLRSFQKGHSWGVTNMLRSD
jgi:hypothetical protein